MVQQVEVHDDSYDHVYQIHGRLHMMANYDIKKKSRMSSHQSWEKILNTDDLGSAGIGSVQK